MTYDELTMQFLINRTLWCQELYFPQSLSHYGCPPSHSRGRKAGS
jgi:hypothetical protein